jgi:hypothetical protein
MKNTIPFPKRAPAPESLDDLHRTVALLREMVGQLSERVELLEARAALAVERPRSA